MHSELSAASRSRSATIHRVLLATALGLAIAVGSAPAAEICEGCWEIGGRAGYLATSDDVGAESSALLGATGRFHFRPYWSLEFALDLFSGETPSGPDETLTFLTVSGAYTVRAAREQRTRP
jgi:hypothetical protein